MKFNKSIILSFLLFTNVVAIGQSISHSISTPLFSYQLTNVSAFKKEINKKYLNDFYLPNFRYEMTIKDRFIIGLEHYFYFRESQGRPNLSVNQIRALQIQSYSFLLGINTFESSTFILKIGTGLSYHNSWIGKYLDNDSSTFITSTCYKSNKINPVLWASLNYFIDKNFYFSIGIRYNPMLNPFATEQGKNCNGLQTHDRINYGIGQFNVGYRF